MCWQYHYYELIIFHRISSQVRGRAAVSSGSIHLLIMILVVPWPSLIALQSAILNKS